MAAADSEDGSSADERQEELKDFEVYGYHPIHVG